MSRFRYKSPAWMAAGVIVVGIQFVRPALPAASVTADLDAPPQLVDNLNASIDLRALLTYLFLVDEVLKEPLGGAHRDPPAIARSLGEALQRYLLELEALSTEELLAKREARLAGFGVFAESMT
jgi:hypothetical protein